MGRRAGRSRTPTSKARAGTGLAAIILAAGEGTRMKSSRPKVLHEVVGRSLVEHVARSGIESGASPIVVVVGCGADAVRETLSARLSDAPLAFAEQKRRRGTADAVLAARGDLEGFEGDVLILCGDVPRLPARAVRALASRHRKSGAALTVLTAVLDDPSGYGRVIRGRQGRIEAIVEHNDATDEEREIAEINSGIYCAHWPRLLAALGKVRPDNSQGEYYLTDAVRLLIAEGHDVRAVVHKDSAELEGINSRSQLAAVGQRMNRAILERLMAAGVTVVDPASTYVHAGVKIGRDTILHPGVTIEGRTRVGRDCVLRSGVRLTDAVVENGVTILESCVAESVRIGRGTKVGPFAHLRPGTVLGSDCKVGNFVETKKAIFGKGSKASHLSYLGDATLGKGVNVGAGTITCNYDGVNKHRTELADGVFIGSDTQLVAPVKLGKGVYVGAGSTVTKDVPGGALTLSRAEQKIIEGWVARKKAKLAREKKGKK